MSDLNLSILLKLVDRVTTPARKVSRALANIKRDSRVQDLAVAMQRVNHSLGDVGTNAMLLGRRFTLMGLAVAGATGGAFALMRRFTAEADQIAKTADKLGLTVEGLQELRYAAELSGVATQTFDMGFQRFTRRLAEAADGQGEAIKGLKDLGFQYQDLFGPDGKLKPAEQMLEEVADRMVNVEDAGKRVKIAFKLFDSEGVGMVNMLKDGSGRLQEMRAELRELGLITDDTARKSEQFNDQWTRVGAIWQGLKATLAAELLPAFQAWTDDTVGWLKNEENRKKLLGDLKDVLTGVWQVIKVFGSTVKWLADSLGGFDRLVALLAMLMGFKLLKSVFKAGAAFWNLGKKILPFVISAFGTIRNVVGGFLWLGKLLAVAIGKDLLKAFKALFLVIRAHPFIAIATAVAAAAYAVYENWEPIKAFFKDLWASISGIFDSAIEALRQKWAGVTEWIRNAVQELTDWMPDWVKEKMGMSATLENAPTLGSNLNRTEVGGTLNIRIDSEGRPKVKEVTGKGGLELDVDTGRMMAGAY